MAKKETEEVVIDGAKDVKTVAVLPFTPKVKRKLTYPQLKIATNVPVYIKIIDKMYLGKEIPSKEGETRKQPPVLMKVVDLRSGTECEMICNKILQSELDDNYKDCGYVGLCFVVEKLVKQDDKAYNGIQVAEIEDPAAA